MASRFLNNITINDEYTLPNADGTADQIITTDGAGQLSFVDQSTINAGNAEHVVIYAKNTHTASIAKGTPVYITGTVGATDTVEIAPADAGDSAKMPAVGLLDDTLAINAFGYVITGGFMDNVTTDPIDGLPSASNDTVYVKVGGGLTLTKPTGSTGLIQNIAKVGKVSGGNSGSLIVSSILRTNDVPNLTTGKIWVGSAANTIESATVHLDETNGRMGIGTTSPAQKLHVAGSIRVGDTNDVVYADKFFAVSNANLHIGANNGYDTVFFNGPADERMRITSSGNVGIGTTSPDYKLEVNGTLGVSRTDGIIFAGSVGTGTGSKIVSNTSNDLIFSTALASLPYTTTERVRVLNNGNVGIGTTSPSTKLHVLGTVGSLPALGAAPSAAQIGGNAFGTLFSTLTSGVGVIQQGRSDGTATSYNLSLQPSGGDVGIGTTSPSPIGSNITTLDIQGFSGGGFRFGTTGGVEGGLWTLGSGTTIGSISNIPLYFRTNNNTKATILANGNVGVATTSPSQKFHVNGTALIESTLYIDDTSSSIYRFFNELIIQNTASTSISIGGGPGSVTNNLEVNGIVTATASTDAYKGYIKQTIATIANEKGTATANYNLIPYNTLTTTTSNQYYNRMAAAYDGRIKKVYIVDTGGTTPDATVVNLKKQVNNVTSSTVYSATVTGSGSGMSAVYNFADNDFTFNAGDTFGILYQTTDSGGGARTMGGVAINIIIEYNIT